MSTLALFEQAPSAGLTDDALATWIGTSGGTDYHPLGTASMLPQAKGGVVDTTLTVRSFLSSSRSRNADFFLLSLPRLGLRNHQRSSRE